MIKAQHIASMTNEEFEQAVELHLKVFNNDPYITEAILGGDTSLWPSHARSVLRAVLLEGYLYAVVVEGKFVSMGYFFRPERSIFQTEAQRALGYHDWFDKLSPEAADWHKNTNRQVRKTAIEPNFSDEDRARRWWCSGLLTDPDHQHKGYARAVINGIMERISESNGVLGLVTTGEPNVMKYKAMAFEEKLVYQLPTIFGEKKMHFFMKTPSPP